MRIFFPVGLTLLITILDFTLDRLPINADDPLMILRNIKSKQEVFWQEAKDLRKVLDELPEELKGEDVTIEKRSEYWKTSEAAEFKQRCVTL